MSYQVIARKYRPQRFSDVVGQEHVTQTLSNAIRQNRIAHAYLFVGPRGTGKTTLARIFAKCLNCTDGPKVDFSDGDPRCQEIAEGRSLDVLEIDGASNRGIEEIRELRETVKYAPATSRFKIYIIDEVHMLTKEAFNALLKTLEEPPSHVKFMFATTEPEKVLATILSRCQRFDLRRIPAALIVQHLASIAQREQVEIDEAALHAIARGADGGMRDAESALDQLISFCGDRIVESDVLSMFGLTSRNQVFELAHSVLAGDCRRALEQLEALASKGKDLGRLLSDLLNHFRNLLLFQVSQGDLSLLEVSEAELESLRTQASQCTTDALTRIMDLLSEAEGRIRDAASKRIALEVSLLKAIQARTAVSIDAVLQKLQALRGAGPDRLEPGSPAPAISSTPAGPAARTAPAPEAAKSQSSAPPPAPTTTSPASPTPPPAIPGASAMASVPVELGELWARVIEAVGRVSPFTRSYLLEAHPVSLAKNVFTIGIDPEFADHLSLVDNQKNRALLQTKIQELGHGEVQVKFIQAEAPLGWKRPVVEPTEPPAVTPAPATVASAPASRAAEVKPPPPKPVMLSKEDFKNDPLIKQALEIFKGQIVDIRA